jgi:hypothetical protein
MKRIDNDLWRICFYFCPARWRRRSFASISCVVLQTGCADRRTDGPADFAGMGDFHARRTCVGQVGRYGQAAEGRFAGEVAGKLLFGCSILSAASRPVRSGDNILIHKEKNSCLDWQF